VISVVLRKEVTHRGHGEHRRRFSGSGILYGIKV
jgi:hypothetical protein